MGKLVFITGGARSGKSAFAQNQALRISGAKRAFIATAEPMDEEMRERIERHKAERGDGWDTFEEPVDLAGRLINLSGHNAVVIDCLTLWLSNLMHRNLDIEVESDRLISALLDAHREVYVVSNEVGMGIVPDNELARRFRDMAGALNGRIAEQADEVYLMVSGLPLKIK